MGFDRAQTELSLVTAGKYFSPIIFGMMGVFSFLLGLIYESGCACLSLVGSSIEQRIGKRNYLGPGAWEAAGASTRGSQAGCVIVTVGEEPRSCGDRCRPRPLVEMALNRVSAYQVTVWLWQLTL